SSPGEPLTEQSKTGLQIPSRPGSTAYLKEPNRLRVPSGRRSHSARPQPRGRGPGQAPHLRNRAPCLGAHAPKPGQLALFRAQGERQEKPSCLTLVLVLLPPSKMAAPTPATKRLSGGPGKRALHSVLLLPTCGATSSLPRLPGKGRGLAISLVAISEEWRGKGGYWPTPGGGGWQSRSGGFGLPERV
uniref:Uncharacterized protein n=1 Tax=Suricata suricatta TaxID=37032 RepID=A0A673TBJ0_SURSU